MLLERIELSASSLPRTRSTTELQQHVARTHLGQGRAIGVGAVKVKPSLRPHVDPVGLVTRAGPAHASAMNTGHEKPSREERLAKRLRENLHRRKAQARAHGRARTAAKAEASASSLPKREDGS